MEIYFLLIKGGSSFRGYSPKDFILHNRFAKPRYYSVIVIDVLRSVLVMFNFIGFFLPMLIPNIELHHQVGPEIVPDPIIATLNFYLQTV
jgi:hypothetical protein